MGFSMAIHNNQQPFMSRVPLTCLRGLISPPTQKKEEIMLERGGQARKIRRRDSSQTRRDFLWPDGPKHHMLKGHAIAGPPDPSSFWAVPRKRDRTAPREHKTIGKSDH